MAFESTDSRPVVLCNNAGEPTGEMGIADAHRDEGRLHKAFSVFVFRQADGQWELLIQQRSDQKLLFAGRWANTCCSHPKPGDNDICEAGARRLLEECGFSIPLQVAGSFVYQATDEQAGGSEYEHDTVLVGRSDGIVEIDTDPSEIADIKWIGIAALGKELEQHATDFAPWFRPALEHALSVLDRL